jgi:RNA polymerase sigma-70 factor (ECF subfamily)
MNDLVENNLIQSAKSGYVDAYNELVLLYQERVFNLALRILADSELAADVTQEAFIAAYQHLNSLRGDSFRPWLFRIVTNRCYDELRRQKRRPSQPLQVTGSEEDQALDEPAYLQDPQISSEDQLAAKQLEQAVQDCLRQLPPEFRSVVVLIDLQGMDYQEARQVIRTPLGTLKSRLARARVRLQDCLQGVWELLPDKYRLKIEGSG